MSGDDAAIPGSVELVELKTADEFLRYLTPHDPLWREGAGVQWVFRGHADSDWPLLPSAHRHPTPSVLRALIDRFKPQSEDIYRRLSSAEPRMSEPRVREELDLWAAENEVVHQFVALANQLGMALPTERSKPYRFWEAYSVNYGPLSEPSFGIPEWAIPEVFALAQHHRIPTRLLDWTYSPLPAAFFATEEPDHNMDTGKWTPPGGKLCVWALNRHHSSVLLPLREVPLRRSFNLFAMRQDGLLVYDHSASKRFVSEGIRVPFDVIATKSPLTDKIRVSPGKPFRKVTLPWSEVGELRRLLWHHRISRAHLMPTFDRIADTTKEICVAHAWW